MVAKVTDEHLRLLEEVHLETIKGINKQFIDPANEAFKICNPFAPFLAWASQFIILCKQSHQLDKVHRDLKKAEDDMQAKTEKKVAIKGIIDSLEKEGYVELFRQEIDEDQRRIEKYQAIQASISARAVDEQQVYQNFEKRFFQDLEEFVIKKKLAQGMLNAKK